MLHRILSMTGLLWEEIDLPVDAAINDVFETVNGLMAVGGVVLVMLALLLAAGRTGRFTGTRDA